VEEREGFAVMTTLREAVKNVLKTDATLLALATGGIYDAEDVGRKGLTIETIRGSGVAINPAIFLRWTTENRLNPDVLRVQQAFVQIYFYQDVGFDICRQMRQRVLTLLHQQSVAFDEPSGWYCFALVWVGDVLEQYDDQLGGAHYERSRYQVDIGRPI
jgi:hypothetical protein